MHRLLKEDGRILIVAMDHTSFMDAPVEGLVRYADTCRSVVPAGADQVLAYAMVPVIILGGSQKDSVRELYQQVYDAVIVAGCAGVAIGNNIWRNPDPAAITRGLAAIIHGDASVDEALTVAGQTAELVAS